MTTIRRTGPILGAAALAAACSTTTGGAPHPVTAAPPSSSRVAASPTTTSVAPLSDEDQVRQTLLAFQDAANSQNWDAYLELMCAPERAKFTGSVMDYLKKARAQDGPTTITITSVTINGDDAEARYVAHNETRGPASAGLPLKREEDGWKICQLD